MKTEVVQNIVLSVAGASQQYPLHSLMGARKSPRAFTEQPIEPEKLRSVLEAARWAPSASNIQPWRFVVAAKDRQGDHERMVDLLFEGNKVWASKAPVLILSVAQVTDQASRKTNKFAFHDVGLATENLVLQATSAGLAAHLMGGFHADRARATFNIPPEYEPVAIIALGYEGGVEFLPQPLLERELAPRVRKQLSEFVFGSVWDAASTVVENERTKIVDRTINN
jgi:nitroreductase